jgi:thiamine pyrophosphokinase
MKKFMLAFIIAIALLGASGELLSAPARATPASYDLGDLSSFDAIAKETLTLVEKGDLVSAEKRITDFETAWDKAEHELYHKDKTAWGVVDDAADRAISSLTAKRPTQANAKLAVAGLVAAIQNPSVP